MANKATTPEPEAFSFSSKDGVKIHSHAKTGGSSFAKTVQILLKGRLRRSCVDMTKYGRINLYGRT